jgi:hypothetical protein
MRVRLRTIEFAPRDRRNIAARNGWSGEATRDELTKWVYDTIDRELLKLDQFVHTTRRQGEGMFPTETLVAYHLNSNLYPPLSAQYVPMAMAALRATEGGDYDAPVDGPNGLRMRASEVIREFNMEGLLPPSES